MTGRVRTAAIELMEAVERTADHTEWFRSIANLKTALNAIPDIAQAAPDLIHPDVLMNVVNAKINDYVELHNRGDLTEHGDHAWLAMTNLRRDLEFALKGSVVSSTLREGPHD